MRYRSHHKDRERIVEHEDWRAHRPPLRVMLPRRRYQRHLQFPEPASYEEAKDAILDCSVVEVKDIGREWSPWVIVLDGSIWESHETRALAIRQARKFSKLVRGKIGDPPVCDQRLLLFKPPREHKST